jgi:hypothetical protein
LFLAGLGRNNGDNSAISTPIQDEFALIKSNIIFYNVINSFTGSAAQKVMLLKDLLLRGQ